MRKRPNEGAYASGSVSELVGQKVWKLRDQEDPLAANSLSSQCFANAQ